MTKRSVRYFWIALGLSAFGLAALGTSAFAYWRALHRFGLSSYSEDWGSFGAFVSGIAGTAIALATLVALAVTFALQARELENSRHSVERQIFDNTFFQLLQRFNGIGDSLVASNRGPYTGGTPPHYRPSIGRKNLQGDERQISDRPTW